MARPRENERTFDDLLREDLKTRNYKPVYVFDGPDSYRIDAVVDRLQADALDAASAAFNVHNLQGDQCSWPQAVQQASSYPLLGARQLIRVRHVDRMGRDDAGEHVPPGPYIAVLSRLEPGGGRRDQRRLLVVASPRVGP